MTRKNPKDNRFTDLSKALRDNLLKRKAQQRSRKEDTDTREGQEDRDDAPKDGGHNRD